MFLTVSANPGNVAPVGRSRISGRAIHASGFGIHNGDYAPDPVPLAARSEAPIASWTRLPESA
ncbi:hypothetical protein MJ8_16260 [Mesorhizobium sp. J8]|nr:hypothetical protein MJ8_16260 [Mesorhizobium sp. J8]